MSEHQGPPWLSALASGDEQQLHLLLSQLLKADVSQLRVERTAGERFTGGRSTPVWKLHFTAIRGDKSKSSQLVVKWVRFPSAGDERLRSYSNERDFYQRVGPTVRKACRIPHMLHCEVAPTEVCFILDDLSVDFPLHPECLSVPAMHGALRWLAQFHALFWEADAAGGSFPVSALGTADYWGLAKRGSDGALDAIAPNLFLSCKVLKAHDAWDAVKSLGVRLTAAARALDACLRRPKGFVRHRTLLHGDFKAANMFLRNLDGEAHEAAVLDFEYSGPGLVAVDLACLLFPDLRMNLLDDEAGLLHYYHACLMQQLDDLGSGADFPLGLFLRHYAAARCDYMRYMLSRGWTACTAGDVALAVQVEKDLQSFDGGKVLTCDEYESAIAACF